VWPVGLSAVAGATMAVVVLSDAELVSCWRAGDARCAELLLDRCRASMHGVAVSMLGRGPNVDDVVQDALLVGLSRLETLGDPDAAGAWLLGITRNLCRHRYREAHDAP
jgi:DNA-directed RNA polymerase specialized sigma24 family protein